MSGLAVDKSNDIKELNDIDELTDVIAVKVFAASGEHVSLSGGIAAMYEAALGKNGVKKEGHEAYPDPDLFSESGIKSTLEAGERTIALAQIEEEGKTVVVGAMVADKMSPYHVEFNSMAVPVARRGRGTGSAIVAGLADIVDQSPFTVNCTELVTHSLASQAAHFHNGFRAICGFGFCHYPNVFFADHPESVLWVTRLQGKLIPSMKKFRGSLGRKLGKHSIDVKQKLIAGQASGQVSLAAGRLDDSALNTVAEVLKERTAYVPKRYHNLVEAILFQFEDILDRTVKSYVRPNEVDTDTANTTDTASDKDGWNEPVSVNCVTVDKKEGFGHSYITVAPEFIFTAPAIDGAIDSVKRLDKRYIKICLPANSPETIKTAEYLHQKGFVFHSYLPLYGFSPVTDDASPEAKSLMPELYDVLSLQWIKPSVIKDNPLPGETDSVIKLYGYPENLSGPILRTISRELHEKTGDI